MEENKLSDDVVEQIKDFNHWRLTEEQKLLIDELILNKELKERYENYGLCRECKQPNTISFILDFWCQLCNSRRFQQNFNNWTSGNNDIDKFIQNVQLKAKNCREVLEWIEYDRFENIEYLAKQEFGISAIWKDGYIVIWDSSNNQWKRHNKKNVVLKHDLQNITEFLRKIESRPIPNNLSDVNRCYGITKDSETNNFMMVMDSYGLCNECMQLYITYDTWSHQSCNAKRFQKNFQNWTSGNCDIDKFIQNAQLKAKNYREVLEWIEYDRFENIKYLIKDEFGTTYKASWKDGYIRSWDSKNNQWRRQNKNMDVALKCLHDSKNITEFLREIESHLKINNSKHVICCYGITKPETNNFEMVMNIDSLCNKCMKFYTGPNCWCQSCNAKRFQQNFKNWTSGNHDIDEFIQNAQLKAKNPRVVLEWIEYDKIKNIKYLAKDGFEIVYEAYWEDGIIESWDSKNNQWYRRTQRKVALKCSHNSQNIPVEFLGKIDVVQCFGITKDPETNNFMIVMDYSHFVCNKCMKLYIGYDTWSHQTCNAERFQQNFTNWTSGNHDVDEFIQNSQLNAKNGREVLEWIKYDKFENIEYLAKGGFGITYKAIWKDGYIESWDSTNNKWKRQNENIDVALKCLLNSQDITVEFLREIGSHLITNNSAYVIRCYGITKDPETNNFIIVMDYAQNGNLRQHLDNSFNSLNWSKKLDILQRIAHGLSNIHDNRLIHRDFHCGNILNALNNNIYIADLGLCHPANAKPSQSDSKDSKKVYGILPYVAPEVLRKKEYNQASDIYGFGIVTYEVCTGLPPYHNEAHKEFLAIRICQGLRPNSNYKIPQLILDIIKQCWDADPLKRPKSKELDKSLQNLYQNAINKRKRIDKQIKEADKINQLSSLTASSSEVLSYTMHPQSVYTSRLLDFENLPEPKNANDGDNLFGTEYSGIVKLLHMNN